MTNNLCRFEVWQRRLAKRSLCDGAGRKQIVFCVPMSQMWLRVDTAERRRKDAQTHGTLRCRGLFLLVVQFSILFQINPDVKAVYGLCVGMAGSPPLAPPTSPLMRKCPPGGAMGRADGRWQRRVQRVRRPGEYAPGEPGTARQDWGWVLGRGLQAHPLSPSLAAPPSPWGESRRRRGRSYRPFRRSPYRPACRQAKTSEAAEHESSRPLASNVVLSSFRIISLSHCCARTNILSYINIWVFIRLGFSCQQQLR